MTGNKTAGQEFKGLPVRVQYFLFSFFASRDISRHLFFLPEKLKYFSFLRTMEIEYTSMKAFFTVFLYFYDLIKSLE